MLKVRRPSDDRRPPFRLRKGSGPPRCLIEAVAQEIDAHRALLFVLVVSMLTLVSVIFNIRLR